MNNKINVSDILFDNITKTEAVEIGMKLLGGEKASYVVTPNSEIAWACRSDKELMRIVNSADLVLPDGIGVVYGSRILGRPLKEKVGGFDFVCALFAEMAKVGKSVFLFGAKPGVAEAAAEKLLATYPGLVIAGTNDGYFKDDRPIKQKINDAHPDLLLVCLGAPKQEKWMDANKDSLQVKLMAGLGGSLDVFAGVAERAPESWQKLGFEWLYRLKKDPKRIGRMSVLPAFLLSTVGQRLRKG